jgi:hypothetical protein
LRASSNSVSFQNGFADMRHTTSREPNAMIPGNLAPSSRPNMHNRSVTSPSASASFLGSVTTYMSDEDYTEEVFSDGDDERGVPTGELGSFFLENMIKPAKSGMRRLTGGRSRDNERWRENLRVDRGSNSQPPKSPRVPRIPKNVYKSTSPGEAL